MTSSTTNPTHMSMNAIGLIIATGITILLSPLIPVATIGYFFLKLKTKVKK